MPEPRMFPAKPGPWLLQVRFLFLVSLLLTQPAQGLGEGTSWPEKCTVRSSWCSGTQAKWRTTYAPPLKYSCDKESHVTAGLLSNGSVPNRYVPETSVANRTLAEGTVAADEFIIITEQDFTPCRKKGFVPVYLRRAANISLINCMFTTRMCLVLEAPESMIFKIKIGHASNLGYRYSLLVKSGNDTASDIVLGIEGRDRRVYYTRSNVNLLQTFDLSFINDMILQVEVVPAASRPPHFHAFCYADKKGYIQTPADWDGLTKFYSPSTRGCITLEVPEDHVVMISFVNFDIENPDSCEYDIFILHMNTDCQDAGTKICYNTDFSPTVYDEDQRIIAFEFESDYVFENVGFRILYSFHPIYAKPEKLPDGKWNCSVPYFTDFQDHFMCREEVFCADGRDGQTCSNHDFCVKIIGSGDGHGRCYHIFSNLKKNITWEYAANKCKTAGLRLVHLDSTAKWQSFLHATKDLPEDSVFVGFKRAPIADPEMYHLTWRFTDDTLAINVNVSSDKMRERCGRITKRDRNALSSVRCRKNIEAAFVCEQISAEFTQDDNSRDATSLLPALPSEQRKLFELDKGNTKGQMLLAKCRHNHTAHASLACDVATNCSAATDDVLSCASDSRFSPSVPFFECDMGSQFVPYSLVCDHREDCCDGSDEHFCQFLPCSEWEWQCRDKKQCVDMQGECDGMSHCVDGSDEFQCSKKEISQQIRKRLKVMPPAMVKFTTSGDFDVTALNSSACPDSHFRCPGTGYCLPVYVLCNGVFDCPGKQDETRCDFFTCPGFYRCRKSTVCVHYDNLCDKKFHCPQHDDELHCSIECPYNCTCYGYAFICTGEFFVKTPEYKQNLSYVDASDTGMTPANFSQVWYLNHLTLRRCEITAIGTVELPNLQTLDLTDNRLTAVTGAELNQLKNLRYLSLARNPLASLDPTLDDKYVFPNIYELNIAMVNIVELTETVFETFPNLRVLNLSDSNLKLIPESGFQSLKELRKLDLRECSLQKIPRGIFDGLEKLENVFSYNYMLCCPSVLPAGFDPKNCLAPTDEVSSCDALLRSETFRVFLTIYALFSLVGNLGSFVYRNVIEKVAVRMGFDVFVTHLCVADFLMGVYLAIIGVADRIYYGDYIWNDLTWRHSAACKIAGFLSFLSSEMSAFLICLITLERFLVLRFPYSNLRFNRRSAHVTCIALWIISLGLATVPLFPTLEHWHFYSQSGICIPLPITRKPFPGKDYSFGVMIGLNFLLFLLVAVGQGLIYHSIRSNTMANKSSSKSKDMTIAHRLLAIVMTDFFCWFPIGMLGIMARSGVAISGDINVGMAIFVLPSNSALNPFLYTFNMVMERRRKARQDRLSETKKTQYTPQSSATNRNDEVNRDIEKMWTESEALMLIDAWLDARVLSKDAIKDSMKKLRQRLGDMI